MTELRLTRAQVEKLYVISRLNETAERFTLVTDSSNGIGPCISVLFKLFKDSKEIDTQVNITDMENW